jgi:hypothetical protein
MLVLRRRAHRHIQTLDQAELAALGARLGLLYPHLLPGGLLRVALNPFHPWAGAGGVPLSVSDIALHRLTHSSAASKSRVRVVGDGLMQMLSPEHVLVRRPNDCTALLIARLMSPAGGSGTSAFPVSFR